MPPPRHAWRPRRPPSASRLRCIGLRGEPVADVLRHAGTADLVVLSQRDPHEADGAPRHIIERLIVGSGTPLLFVPHADTLPLQADGAPRCGLRVLVAWSPSRESARALRDAMPLLAGAERVELIRFAPAGETPPEPLDAVAAYLQLHGIARLARGAAHAGAVAGRTSARGLDGRRADCRSVAVACGRHRRRPAGDGRLRPPARLGADTGRRHANDLADDDGAGVDVALSASPARRGGPESGARGDAPTDEGLDRTFLAGPARRSAGLAGRRPVRRQHAAGATVRCGRWHLHHRGAAVRRRGRGGRAVTPEGGARSACGGRRSAAACWRWPASVPCWGRWRWPGACSTPVAPALR